MKILDNEQYESWNKRLQKKIRKKLNGRSKAVKTDQVIHIKMLYNACKHSFPTVQCTHHSF